MTESEARNTAGEPFRILFVCTGNTCRSPLAAALTRQELDRRGWGGVEVASAGVMAAAGSPASDGALRVARRHGLELDAHRSRPLTGELLEWADLVLTMSPSHLVHLQSVGAGDRAAVITSFARGGGREAGAEGEGDGSAAHHHGVPDPFGADDEAYEATYRALLRLVRGVVERLAPVLAP